MTQQTGTGRPRVVVGVDGSSGARAALRFALEDAARRGVPLEVVAAYRPPEEWLDFYVVRDVDVDPIERTARERAQALLDEVLPAVPRPPAEVAVRAVLGTAADVLVRESAGADLLVVGSRGHGGFSSVLLGSVGLQCVLHATCAVTVVHSPEAHRQRWLHRQPARRGRSAVS
ncbi:Nucleotide-binding universal stress protein, UspA family [Geodermatophilus pulveris]|uniref:Nucleotide-binding universal stress protein, UspA family n=1 Tax=Geodermatophilus pulveris TaxID=1564159 RepID=A0A239ED29_9ACTN|nr:universal stress protein [Geodermatophilus pulveris]SNS42419.1 Nucleotide-binding universal stress protein, UspA family [Geodermatophilus pulveris]